MTFVPDVRCESARAIQKALKKKPEIRSASCHNERVNGYTCCLGERETLVALMVASKVARVLWPCGSPVDNDRLRTNCGPTPQDENTGGRGSGSWRGQQSPLPSPEQLVQFAPAFGLRCALEKAHFGSTMDTRSPVSPYIFDSNTATATTTPRPLARKNQRNDLLRNLFGSTNLTPLNSRFDQEANTISPVRSYKGNNSTNLTDRQVRSQEYSPMIVSPLQPLRHSVSENDFTVKVTDALSKSDLQPDLIGDFSKCHSLPLIIGKHQDLKSISIDTMACLIRGDFRQVVNDFLVVDCRYPYEYEGGHITNAINIYTKEKLLERFFNENSSTDPPSSTVVIFHCEFSSKRGPKL